MKLQAKNSEEPEEPEDSEEPEESEESESEDSEELEEFSYDYEEETGDMNLHAEAEKKTSNNQASFATSPVVVVGAMMAVVLGVLAITYRRHRRSSSLSYEQFATEEAARLLV
ncbi:unnamed protein product [Heterosigma akashiwo]